MRGKWAESVRTHSWPSLQWLSWLLPGFSVSWPGSSLRMRAALCSENSSPLGSRPSGQGSFSSSSLSWAVCLCRWITHKGLSHILPLVSEYYSNTDAKDRQTNAFCFHLASEAPQLSGQRNYSYCPAVKQWRLSGSWVWILTTCPDTVASAVWGNLTKDSLYGHR